jgi:capsular exopolysaccharide synthesis family protein
MELRQVFDVLLRRGLVILLVAGVATGVVAVVGVLTPPVYEAQTTVRVLLDVGVTDFKLRGEDIDRLFTTYSEVLVSQPILEEAVTRLSGESRSLSVGEARRSVEVDPSPNSELIIISATHGDPATARDLANMLADLLIEYAGVYYVGRTKSAPQIVEEQFVEVEQELAVKRQELAALVAVDEDSSEAEALARQIRLKEESYQRLLDRYELVKLYESLRANGVKVIVPASLPTSPSNSLGRQEIILALAIGLFGGIGLAVVLENLDTRIHSPRQLENLTQMRVLGSVPRGNLPLDGPIGPSTSGKTGSLQEAYQLLSINLQALDQDRPIRTILLASATPREATSDVALNLSAALSQFGQKVVVVDAYLQMPTVHKILDLPNSTGLSNILEDNVPLDMALQNSRIPGVQILTTGPVPSNPAEGLASSEMKAVTKALERRFEATLLHGGSLFTATDAAVLARIADGVLLLVDQRESREGHVQSALKQLQAVRTEVLGLVLVQKGGQARSYF